MNTSVHRGTALITRATSRIGAAYADRLARRGYDLILAARELAHLNALATRLTDETGRSVETLAVDPTDDDHVSKIEHVLRTDASITLLVIDACIAPNKGVPRPRAAKDGSRSTSMQARLARAVAPAFVARGVGTIISLARFEPGSHDGASPLACARALHREFAINGCRVQHVLADIPDPKVIRGLADAHRFSHVAMWAEGVVDGALHGLDRGELLIILRHAYSDRNAMLRGDSTPGSGRRSCSASP